MISRRRFVGAVGLPAVAAASGVTIAPRLEDSPGHDRFCDAVEHAIRHGIPA